jgi:hypothetical protein
MPTPGDRDRPDAGERPADEDPVDPPGFGFDRGSRSERDAESSAAPRRKDPPQDAVCPDLKATASGGLTLAVGGAICGEPQRKVRSYNVFDVQATISARAPGFIARHAWM